MREKWSERQHFITQPGCKSYKVHKGLSNRTSQAAQRPSPFISLKDKVAEPVLQLLRERKSVCSHEIQAYERHLRIQISFLWWLTSVYRAFSLYTN